MLVFHGMALTGILIAWVTVLMFMCLGYQQKLPKAEKQSNKSKN